MNPAHHGRWLNVYYCLSILLSRFTYDYNSNYCLSILLSRFTYDYNSNCKMAESPWVTMIKKSSIKNGWGARIKHCTVWTRIVRNMTYLVLPDTLLSATVPNQLNLMVSTRRSILTPFHTGYTNLLSKSTPELSKIWGSTWLLILHTIYFWRPG